MTDVSKAPWIDESLIPLRLSAVIGPFSKIHHERLKKASIESNLEILHHPLCCFEVSLEVSLGPKVLMRTYITPIEYFPTSSPFLQQMSFPSNVRVDIPYAFYSLSKFTAKVTLYHKLPFVDSIVVCEGNSTQLLGQTVFPLYGETKNITAGIVVCDLMRAHAPTAQIQAPNSFLRSPSPPSPFRVSNSFEQISNEQNLPFVGDIAHFAGSVTDTFSVLLQAPDHVHSFDAKVGPFKKPRLFGSATSPTAADLPRLRQLNNRPFISGFTDQMRTLIYQFPDYFSRTASGFLKVLELTKKVYNFPQMSIPLALTVFTIPKADPRAYAHALSCLTVRSDDDLRVYLQDIVQVGFIDSSVFQFLVTRSLQSHPLAVASFWLLKLETTSESHSKIAEDQLSQLEDALDDDLRNDIHRGEMELHRLEEIVIKVKSINGREEKKAFVVEQLKGVTFEKPFHLPLEPSFIVERVSCENVIVFGSSLQPVKMDFFDAEGHVFSAILKVGDDMRQDALVIMAVRFIDDVLKHFGLNKYLKPYAVLPITRKFGLCEFVAGAKSVSKILSQYSSIDSYFDQEYVNECMIKFQGSTAAYTVMSYLLGVGDRHLDNLLCTPQGQFLHVDFGFMFGCDPKPVNVAVRVVDEMMDAMHGGQNQFIRDTVVVHNAIRKRADDFCAMVALMKHADLPHLQKTDQLLANFLMERLCLDMTEVDAGQKIISEVNYSLTSIYPKIWDSIHNFAQRNK